MEKRYYFAVACKNGGYTVAENTSNLITHKNIGDCRTFATFKEADEAAKYIAEGKSDIRPAGIYINNR